MKGKSCLKIAIIGSLSMLLVINVVHVAFSAAGQYAMKERELTNINTRQLANRLPAGYIFQRSNTSDLTHSSEFKNTQIIQEQASSDKSENQTTVSLLEEMLEIPDPKLQTDDSTEAVESWNSLDTDHIDQSAVDENHVREPAEEGVETEKGTLTKTVKSSQPIQLSSISKLLEQRNSLSRIVNLKQQALGKLECEKVANGEIATSQAGGFCKNQSTEDGGQHITDEKLAVTLADFLADKLVASFGDGPGRYKAIILESGKVKGYDAYDGAPFCDVTSEGRVQFLDLTLPQYGLPIYDWVMSLEVAEHIPQMFESTFIDNIIRHAREGVILSWAKLGQRGYAHINNRPFEYIRDLMNRLGFSHDEENSVRLKDAASLYWLQWNINVYRRNSDNPVNEFEA